MLTVCSDSTVVSLTCPSMGEVPAAFASANVCAACSNSRLAFATPAFQSGWVCTSGLRTSMPSGITDNADAASSTVDRASSHPAHVFSSACSAGSGSGGGGALAVTVCVWATGWSTGPVSPPRVITTTVTSPAMLPETTAAASQLGHRRGPVPCPGHGDRPGGGGGGDHDAEGGGTPGGGALIKSETLRPGRAARPSASGTAAAHAESSQRCAHPAPATAAATPQAPSLADWPMCDRRYRHRHAAPPWPRPAPPTRHPTPTPSSPAAAAPPTPPTPPTSPQPHRQPTPAPRSTPSTHHHRSHPALSLARDR